LVLTFDRSNRSTLRALLEFPAGFQCVFINARFAGNFTRDLKSLFLGCVERIGEMGAFG
jgi:hypothetical protein